MSSAKKEFQKLFGIKPDDIEPPLTRQDMWSMIHRYNKQKQNVKPPDLFEKSYTYQVVRAEQDCKDPYVRIARISPDGGIVQFAYVWEKVDSDEILATASYIPEIEWHNPD